MKKQPEQLERVGLIINSEKISSRAVVRRAAELVRAAGKEVLCDATTAGLARLKTGACPTPAELARQVDLLLVFGGDGTILRVVREIDGALTPILGVNIGRLGFLTDVPSQHLGRCLKQIWAGEFFVETRPLLEAFSESNGRKILQRAFNDIVISRGAEPRMIELEVTVNGDMLTSYRCDGLIISSPTGSTAYCLSAGGPIISPDAQVFAITPICPHTLSNRPLIINLSAEIRVKVINERAETTVTADGQVQAHLLAGDVVTIRRSRRLVKLMHPCGNSFFDTVRHKLRWSGSNV